MADRDDRSVLQVTKDSDGVSLQSLNEVLRQIQMNVYKLEGRLGESTVRDDLRVMGKQTWEGQETQVGEIDSGVIYFDATLGKFRASEDGATMVNLLSSTTGVSVKVLYSTAVAYTTAGTAEEIAATYTLPGGSLASDGDYVEVITAITCAANANTKTRSIYFGASPLTLTDANNNGKWRQWANVFRRDATTQYMTYAGNANGSPSGLAGTAAETLANDIIIKSTLTTPTAAGDLTLQYFAVLLYRVNPTS